MTVHLRHIATTSVVSLYLLVTTSTSGSAAVQSSSNTSSPASPRAIIGNPFGTTREPAANSLAVPHQILRSGINLNSNRLSANSIQLADIIKLTPILTRIESLRSQVSLTESPTSENALPYMSLLAAEQLVQRKIITTGLSIDHVLAEINAEQQLYNEILSALQAKVSKTVQYSNWASYYSNGALWAISESLDIPTFKKPRYSIPSGTLGIIAGIVPSIFSLYAMHATNGSKYQGEGDANMLAKVLNAPTNNEVDYPNDVWIFLSSVPPGDKSGKSRKDQLVDRWIADSQLPSFTDRTSRSQIDALSGVSDRKKTVTISLLQTRVAMLSELGAEVEKMKRLLYELSLTLNGEKQI